jgi:predicted negative regulator of RcsB-dependent stress response
VSIYMTEEEQLESIKKWWKKHQNKITVILSITLLSTACYRYWNWHIEKINQQASATYEQLMFAFSEQNTQSIEAYAKKLFTDFSGTVYGDTARLMMAHDYVIHEQLPLAEQSLQDVIQHSKMPALKNLASLRLARLMISQKAYDNALKQLDGISDSTYLPKVNELKGDIYMALGQANKANDFYQKARLDAEKLGVSSLFLDMKMKGGQKATA